MIKDEFGLRGPILQLKPYERIYSGFPIRWTPRLHDSPVADKFYISTGDQTPEESERATGSSIDFGRHSSKCRELLGIQQRLVDFLSARLDLNLLLSSWLNHPYALTVFDLGGLPFEVMDLVVGMITRILFETAFWGRDLPGIGRQAPLLLVFEEAHAYVPRGENKFIQVLRDGLSRGYSRKDENTE